MMILDQKGNDDSALAKQLVLNILAILRIGRMYKDDVHPLPAEHVKKLGDFIRFSNEGKPTRAEQAKRVSSLFSFST